MIANRKTILSLLAAIVAVSSVAQSTNAQAIIGNFCRVKGQETVTLRGVGLVVGLNGSGDPNLPATSQTLARALVNSGLTVPVDAFGREDAEGFQNAANSALVFVTATVPAEGARQGTLINCQVSTFGSANSLSGGFLLQTALTGGPAVGDSGELPVYAMATGKIQTNPLDVLTVGEVRNGCQLSVDIDNKFTYFEEYPPGVEVAPLPNGAPSRYKMYVDLVLDTSHAGWFVASKIAEDINEGGKLLGLADDPDSEPEVIAKPLDQVTIQVRVPPHHLDDPVSFISDLLNIPVSDIQRPIVKINRATGTIVIGKDVMFRPMAITSGDFSIEDGPFRAFSLEDTGPVRGTEERKLGDLVSALNSLQASSETTIDIIIQLSEAGAIIGEVDID